jgi:hypothetical protein
VPVPALVTAEQFDLVARRLAANQRAARRSTTHPYLLRGLVSCGVCRLSCSGVTRTATDTRYRYYRCRGKLAQVSSGRASCCPARFIPATQLDELVWADLCAVLQHPELVAQALERAHSGAWVPRSCAAGRRPSAASGPALHANASGCWRPTWPRRSTWPPSSGRTGALPGRRPTCWPASGRSPRRASGWSR